MCKCTQTDGYVQAMQNAKTVEKKTGVEQAVFTKNGISYFGKREDVAKQEGICCYILTTGEEIQIDSEKSKAEAAETAAEVLKDSNEEDVEKTSGNNWDEAAKEVAEKPKGNQKPKTGK